MDNTRLPKHALNHNPRGRRDRGRPRNRWQFVDAEQVKRPNPWSKMMMMMMMMTMVMMMMMMMLNAGKWKITL